MCGYNWRALGQACCPALPCAACMIGWLVGCRGEGLQVGARRAAGPCARARAGRCKRRAAVAAAPHLDLG